MVRSRKLTFAALGTALALVSCAAPKAIIVAEAPRAKAEASKKEMAKVEKPIVSDEPVPALPDDGIRMPEMLALPGEGDFRATNPAATKTGGQAGAVISRPPTDPPSRVKPKEKE